MNQYGSYYNNPYLPQYGPSYASQAPQTQVVKVNGENGARAFQMGANSSALLLDESGTIVWLAVSDGAGYRTVTPYDITPHRTEQEQNLTNLETRIARLEEIIHGNAGNTQAVKRNPRPDDKPAGQGTDGRGEGRG